MRITGYLTDEDYDEWLYRADCAVQLRETDFGESTGTVSDAIAAGLPVITSVRSCTELPEGTVVNVDPLIEPTGLAATIERVVFDESVRRALAARMSVYASEWGFGDVASRLTAIIDASVAPASRPFLTVPE